jgi:hypothetical protein
MFLFTKKHAHRESIHEGGGWIGDFHYTIEEVL